MIPVARQAGDLMISTQQTHLNHLLKGCTVISHAHALVAPRCVLLAHERIPDHVVLVRRERRSSASTRLGYILLRALGTGSDAADRATLLLST